LGVSDFDTTHMLTADWVYSLPFYRGTSKVAKATVGGWQLTGLARVTSGLPFGLAQGSNFSTDWPQISWMVQTAPVKVRKLHPMSRGEMAQPVYKLDRTPVA